MLSLVVSLNASCKHVFVKKDWKIGREKKIVNETKIIENLNKVID